MIPSIEIKNYKNLDGLTINSFSRVNLITGKNNTGKSSLLEAIFLFITNFNGNSLAQIFKDRNENYQDTDEKKLASLFTNRNVKFTPSDAIVIKSHESIKQIRFVKYYDEKATNFFGSRPIIIEEETENVEYKIGVELTLENTPLVYSFEFVPIEGIKTFNKEINYQFIKANTIDSELNYLLWSLIVLTPKEEQVIAGLKIIDPSLERITFDTNKIAITKVGNNRVPLRSMGDGINRILTIILALVNCENGYLFIDEFENGLHHSVQEKVWEIIFKLSETLNIQVFATTHSEDCIAGFEAILNSATTNFDGKLIRLDNRKGKIIEVEFTKEDLKIATNQNIEIR